MKTLLVTIAMLCFYGAKAQTDEAQILTLLDNQTKAWNRGDLEGFMGGYWQSDSLLFVGKNGPTYGWQATLANYKRNYSSQQQMGQLQFTILKTQRLAADAYFVLGKWDLSRGAEVGNLKGYYTLIFKKFTSGWKIGVRKIFVLLSFPVCPADRLVFPP